MLDLFVYVTTIIKHGCRDHAHAIGNGTPKSGLKLRAKKRNEASEVRDASLQVRETEPPLLLGLGR